MRLHEAADRLDLPATHVAEGAWDAATRRVRRRRSAVVATSATAVVVVLVATLATTQDDQSSRPPANPPAPSTSLTPSADRDPVVDGPEAQPRAVVVDPDEGDRRAVLWWSCDACDTLDGALVLTEDGFATRTVVPIEADRGLVSVGEGHVAVVDWDSSSTELVDFSGVSRSLRLGEEEPAPPGASVITATVGGTYESVWVDVGRAIAHPVPRPEAAAGASDESVWRDANGLVWFGWFEGDHVIATSQDGGASWDNTHSFGGGYLVPTYSGAEDVMAVLEYEDANRASLPFVRAWYSTDGGVSWAGTPDSSAPADPIKHQGGLVRADGRLLMHAPGDAGLLLLDDAWSTFAPAAWTPGGGGNVDLLGIQGWGDGLSVVGRPDGGAEVYLSSTPGDDWEPLRVR